MRTIMKKIIAIVILLIITTSAVAKPIVGDWHGQLKIQSMKLRISFHVTQTGDAYHSTMDSPDQGAMGIPTTSTTFKDNILQIEMKNMNAKFEGRLADGKISGTFKQGGMDLPLVLLQKGIAITSSKPRPQEPTKPYAYKSEDVYFTNNKAKGIKLAGTLTLPKNLKNPPVAIMISGSGPQNRDEEVKVFNHRPFLVWSDYLTKNGVAVLRFDDRGVGESEGSQLDATSADFATDVQAAFTYLKTRADVIDTNKIGLIGHSEGGLIAPMVAANNNDIAFIVLLAGPGVNGGEVLRTQVKRASELSNQNSDEINFNEKISKVAFDMVRKETDLDKLKKQLKTYFIQVRDKNPKMMPDEMSNDKLAAQVKSLTSAWVSYFIRTDPDQFLSKVKCPILAINGSLDFQVMPELNLGGIRKSLLKANNKDVTIKQLEGLNHLFQTAKTGASDEYSIIEETISPVALKLVTNWINIRFNNEQFN